MVLKWKSLAGLVALLAISCAPLAAQSKETSPQEKEHLKLALNFWREVVIFGHVDLAPKYMAEDYVDHDPNREHTRAAFVEQIGSHPPQPIQKTFPHPPLKAYAKGDYVVFLWELDEKDPANPSTTSKYNSFDILRIQNGKIQEHWDTDRRNPPEMAKQ
jgi:predicted SnoaL-like aldol condensation-catalyzing enzyme